MPVVSDHGHHVSVTEERCYAHLFEEDLVAARRQVKKGAQSIEAPPAKYRCPSVKRGLARGRRAGKCRIDATPQIEENGVRQCSRDIVAG